MEKQKTEKKEKEKIYNFGEKTEEYSAKDSKMLPVWQSPKYLTAKKKVIEMLESEQYKDVLEESDFWILMNRTKSGKMAYTGLIISHNGCLKINDTLPEELKFNPKCIRYYSNNEDYGITYNDSLIFEYDSSRLEEDKQKIFEIGEVSSKNCTNDYPYAMALKRCMDRVILKNSKLAYSGVYSDSEAEEFKEPDEEPIKVESISLNEEKDNTKIVIYATEKQQEVIKELYKNKIEELKNILSELGKKKINELSIIEASNIIQKAKQEEE